MFHTAFEPMNIEFQSKKIIKLTVKKIIKLTKSHQPVYNITQRVNSIISKMYNQFTALDQKPLPMGKIILNPMQVPKANKRKKKKLNSKNPYKIKKIKIRGEQAMAQKFVDGLLLLKLLHVEHPKQVISANISYKRIIEINPDHLEYFTNLVDLNCSQNYIPLEQLRKLPNVEHINIAHNQLKELNLEAGGFYKLKKLNLSFNMIQSQYINQLTMLPCLVDLDLSYNDLQELPDNMQNFTKLKKLNLQGNNFRSDHKAALFWASLASLPTIEFLSVSRNRIRGIHTEKLVAGNFSTLIQLDFSYNFVQNQHNLICARNFTSLKKLYITGNPFVEMNQYKGLEMQIYARTGAEVIVQKVNPYYLKSQKPKRPQIKFQNIVTVKTDTFMKKNRNVLFGIDLSKDDELFSSQSDQQPSQQQESSSEQENQEQPMFVTEQINQKKKKKTAKRLQQVSEDASSQHNNSQLIVNQHKQQISSKKSALSSSNLSRQSGSIDYGDFHKVAAELLGDEKEYKKSFDIHTSYKALKKALDRAGEEF